jgi:hypothetical protein
MVFLGPLDFNPELVALERPLAGLFAHSIEGRLIVSEDGGRSRLLLAFMSINGPSTETLASAIGAAAAGAQAAAS